MKMYLDTSNNKTILKLDDKIYEWESGRDLAENLHKFIKEKLAENNASWRDISEITFFSGPGSFTGLRIGASVVNSLADQLRVPLFDHHDNKVPLIMPDYGREANITAPKK